MKRNEYRVTAPSDTTAVVVARGRLKTSRQQPGLGSDGNNEVCGEPENRSWRIRSI
jgi:hypothetical protein